MASRAKKAEPPAMSPEQAAALLEAWHGISVTAPSAEVAAADFARVNRLAGAAADAQHDFWQSPADLRTLLEGDA